MPPVGFEPKISAGERPATVVAAVIAQCYLYVNEIPTDFDPLTCHQLLKILLNILKCKIEVDAT